MLENNPKESTFNSSTIVIRYKVTCARSTNIVQVRSTNPTNNCPICHSPLTTGSRCMTVVKIVTQSEKQKGGGPYEKTHYRTHKKSNGTMAKTRDEVLELQKKHRPVLRKF
ncbi:MAG: hypothetical protein WAZ40_02280 [Minisyncoccia bacterium]